jgi:anti-anti-sigma regulatory factor
VLRIERSANGKILFTLSGRIEAEDVEELRRSLAMETAGRQMALDLTDVTLVNEGAVKFLIDCEAENIKLENCSLYIREWIERIKSRSKRLRTR